MKIMTFLLMMVSVTAAQAVQVYKCPGKVEGKFTYQERPCAGARIDEHTLKITPENKQKIAEAQAKLQQEIEAANSQNKSSVPPTDGASPAISPPASTNSSVGKLSPNSAALRTPNYGAAPPPQPATYPTPNKP